ncbi:hypothetical protein [Erwinia aphidicola]|uniref:cold shock small protein YmcF n=1 Tax=Erwinia aphidicola TaxID=68334 RepID=UPI003AFA7766
MGCTRIDYTWIKIQPLCNERVKVAFLTIRIVNQKRQLPIQNIKYQCPSCHGCQYRFSPFSISAKNPHGANCIFCKAQMQVSYKIYAS